MICKHLLGLLLISLHIIGAGATPGDILVESRFIRDADGWTVTNTPGVQPLSVDRSSQRIKSGDDGDVVWYWVAPEKFLGDQRSFFHGVLHYTLGHYMYNEAGGGFDRHGDIILESASHRLVLEAKFLYNISSPFYEYEVPFSGEAFRSSCQAGASSSACKGSGDRCEQDEECCSRQCVAGRARWYNQKTGKPARNSELLRVLTDLSALKIRGGVHSMGAERSFLKEPRILEGGAVNRTLASPTGSEIGSSRSTECRVERTAAIHIRPTGSTELALGVPLARPWTHYFPIPNVPEICTDTTLAVRAKGDILGHGKYVGVLGENGELLGKLFVTAGDYEAGPSTNACRDGADYCTSVFMADEVVLEGEEEDGLVIPRAQMTEFAADGIVSLGLYVEAENLATEVTIVELSLEFGLGGCFSRRLVRFPGIHRTPDRYTGFVASLTVPTTPAPDDAGAVMLNVTGFLDAPESFVSVAFSPARTAGTFGPMYKAVASAGSQREIESTGESWDLLGAANLFTGALQDGRAGVKKTVQQAAAVSKAVISAAREAAAGSGLPFTVLAQALPSSVAHTDSISLHDAGLVYPPSRCHVESFAKGFKGLEGYPIIREEEHCTEVWQCDSVGPSNRLKFSSVGACEANCKTQWIAEIGPVDFLAPGRCYQPYEAHGGCATSGAVCSCSQKGVALCTASGISADADGTCTCLPETACSRTVVNASYPYRFTTERLPAGDVMLYVEAKLPWPRSQQHHLRVRLGEHDERWLGHLYGTPDCSSQCQGPYPDHDPSRPLVDTVRIPQVPSGCQLPVVFACGREVAHRPRRKDGCPFCGEALANAVAGGKELAEVVMADGALDIRIEIDAPRPEIACVLHRESERCFGYGSSLPPDYFFADASHTTLDGNLDDTATSLSTASGGVAGIGLTASMLQCPGGTCTRVFVLVEQELLEVTAIAGDTITVVRGAGSSPVAAHGDGAEIRRIPDPRILPALDNQGEFTLKSLTISYATL